VNDELLLEYTDNRYPIGQVGIGVTSAVTAHFDDFVITGDDVPNSHFPVSSKGKMPTMWGKIKKF